MNHTLKAVLEMGGLTGLACLAMIFGVELMKRANQDAADEANQPATVSHPAWRDPTWHQPTRTSLKGKLLGYWHREVLRGNVAPTEALERIEEIQKMGDNHGNEPRT